VQVAVARKGIGMEALVRIPEGVPSADSVVRDTRDSVRVNVRVCVTDVVSRDTCGEIVHKNWDQSRIQTSLVFGVGRGAIGPMCVCSQHQWETRDLEGQDLDHLRGRQLPEGGELQHHCLYRQHHDQYPQADPRFKEQSLRHQQQRQQSAATLCKVLFLSMVAMCMSYLIQVPPIPL